jgi:hypothetical protein
MHHRTTGDQEMLSKYSNRRELRISCTLRGCTISLRIRLSAASVGCVRAGVRLSWKADAGKTGDEHI